MKVFPEVMIPLTGDAEGNGEPGGNRAPGGGRKFSPKKERKVEYLVGTMIELPRAALVADEIAKEAEFFSFGTNDLTQTTFGFSRDDINKFLPTYLEEGILKQDPFAVLDREGVGQLVRMATERGRKTRPKLKVGICGEHGGEPSSVEFCHQVGLNYVSCSSVPRADGAFGGGTGCGYRQIKSGRRKNQVGISDRGTIIRAHRRWEPRTPRVSASTLMRVLNQIYCTLCNRAISFWAKF